MEGQNEKGHNQGVKYAIEDMEKWLELFQDVEPSQRKSNVLEVAASITSIAEKLPQKHQCLNHQCPLEGSAFRCKVQLSIGGSAFLIEFL